MQRRNRAAAARPASARRGSRPAPPDTAAVSMALARGNGKTDHAHQFARRRARCRSPWPRRARAAARPRRRRQSRAAPPASAADLGDTPGIIVKFRSGGAAGRVQAQAAGDAVSKLAARGGFAIRGTRALPAGLHALKAERLRRRVVCGAARARARGFRGRIRGARSAPLSARVAERSALHRPVVFAEPRRHAERGTRGSRMGIRARATQAS